MYKPKKKNYPMKVFLGRRKGDAVRMYLEGFNWDCDWYWGGGYVTSGDLHCHFDRCFLDVPDSRGHPLGPFYDPWTKLPDYLTEDKVKRIDNGASVWENLSFFLDNVPEHLEKNWWRIKDLYKQFYALRRAAETFHSGGHCTSEGRNPKEIDPEKESMINKHIEEVIIPEIVKVLQNSTNP